MLRGEKCNRMPTITEDCLTVVKEAIALNFTQTNFNAVFRNWKSVLRAGAVPSACYSFSIVSFQQSQTMQLPAVLAVFPRTIPIWEALSGIPPKRYGGVTTSRGTLPYNIANRLVGGVSIRDTFHKSFTFLSSPRKLQSKLG